MPSKNTGSFKCSPLEVFHEFYPGSRLFFSSTKEFVLLIINGCFWFQYIPLILPSGGLYATYHLLGEPETTIEITIG